MNTNKNIVIKIGGSLLFKRGKIDNLKILEFCEIIKKTSKFDKIVVICGGGTLAREFISSARDFTKNNAMCDLFGIEISRINSKLIIACLYEHAYPQVPKSIEDLSIALLSKKIIVMGGLQPGQSTTSVAIEVAEYIKAQKMIILTDVNGIYDKDPKKHKDAKLLMHLSLNELKEVIENSSDDKQAAPGEYRIFDVVSLQVLKRSDIKVFVISGIILDEFRKFWDGDSNIKGTIISK
jgi:uridylate kinase